MIPLSPFPVPASSHMPFSLHHHLLVWACKGEAVSVWVRSGHGEQRTEPLAGMEDIDILPVYLYYPSIIILLIVWVDVTFYFFFSYSLCCIILSFLSTPFAKRQAWRDGLWRKAGGREAERRRRAWRRRQWRQGRRTFVAGLLPPCLAACI